jgi:hypothetical protein
MFIEPRVEACPASELTGSRTKQQHPHATGDRRAPPPSQAKEKVIGRWQFIEVSASQPFLKLDAQFAPKNLFENRRETRYKNTAQSSKLLVGAVKNYAGGPVKLVASAGIRRPGLSRNIRKPLHSNVKPLDQ